MSMKKSLIFIFISAIILSTILSCPVSATYNSLTDTLDLHSENYFLMSLDNGTVIFESNADKQLPPASLTKIVTAAVVLENCEDLSTVVSAPEYCINMLAGTGSSTAGISAGEELTVDSLLHCLLIESANDAALILADYFGQGDIDTFIGMMNNCAKKLGCKNTNFVNPHGLDDDYQFSTPRDVAKLFQHALSFAAFKDIVGLSRYTIPATNMRNERIIINTNKILNTAYKDYYCKYVTGGKTGSTSKAGKCVCTVSSNNGYNYICVVMNAPQYNIDDDSAEENCAFVDTKTMVNWAIKNLELVKIADSTTIAAEVPVNLSRSANYVTLAPAEDKYELVPSGTDSGNVIIEPQKDSLPLSLTAPVKKGDVICKASVLYGGESIAEIDLVATNDISKSIILTILNALGRIFSSLPMKILGLLLLIVIIGTLALILKAYIKKRKSEELHIVTYNDFKK